MNCPSCENDVQKQWVACPFCAARLPQLHCECGEELAATWKACPHCGRPVGDHAGVIRSASSAPTATELPVIRCFQIYVAAHDAFFGVFEDASERIAAAGTASQ